MGNKIFTNGTRVTESNVKRVRRDLNTNGGQLITGITYGESNPVLCMAQIGVYRRSSIRIGRDYSRLVNDPKLRGISEYTLRRNPPRQARLLPPGHIGAPKLLEEMGGWSLEKRLPTTIERPLELEGGTVFYYSGKDSPTAIIKEVVQFCASNINLTQEASFREDYNFCRAPNLSDYHISRIVEAINKG